VGHSASLMLRAVSLHDVARGYIHKYGLPTDFMERLKTETGQVSLGAGWERIAEAFGGSSCITASVESDYLWLEAANEAEAIETLSAMRSQYLEYYPQGDDPESWNASIDDAIEAIGGMRDTRVALGMDAADWELG